MFLPTGRACGLCLDWDLNTTVYKHHLLRGFSLLFYVKFTYDLIGSQHFQEQARKEREELDRMLEENRRRVEEAQQREALELQRKEEERYRELELIQRQKEEAARRKKLDQGEERT